MSNPFLGEIRPFAGMFAPRGWALCNGALISIAANNALFSLLGTTYGGDGQTTFGLPDLQGRTAVGQGQGPGLTLRTLGEVNGTETVTLTIQTMPAHMHLVVACGSTADSVLPTGCLPAAPANGGYFFLPPNVGTQVDQPLAADTISASGGSQPHDNIQPTLAINYIIAMEGIYPQRN